MIFYILSLFVGYLMGSISSAIVVCRLMNLPDPRKEGSRNPGATNVLRVTGSKKAAGITLAGDFLKGLIPVFVIFQWTTDPILASWVLFAAFIGHLYPVFFGFEGGKGVATALGGLFGLSPVLGGLMVVTWALSALLFRISSLAAISAFVGLPVYVFYLYRSWFLVLPLSLVSICLLWRHKANIKRLCEGSEPKIGIKKLK